MAKKTFLLTLAFPFFFSPICFAKPWSNSYVSFDLPSKWDCYLENTAWICRYAISKKCLGVAAKDKICEDQRKKTREAIIILAAKEKGPKDSLQEYHTHLKTPRPIVTKEGRRTQSKVNSVKIVNIHQQQWLDGMHLGSELPEYYTRYLATVKGNVAVLVTFSAHKLYYTKYSKDFAHAVQTLNILASQVNQIKSGVIKNGTGPLGNIPINDVIGDPIDDNAFDNPPSGVFASTTHFLFVLASIVCLFLALFLWYRSRRN